MYIYMYIYVLSLSQIVAIGICSFYDKQNLDSNKTIPFNISMKNFYKSISSN